jgi:hypothetical protein
VEQYKAQIAEIRSGWQADLQKQQSDVKAEVQNLFAEFNA